MGRAARPDELSLPQSSAGEFPIAAFSLKFVVTSVSFNMRKLLNVCQTIATQILTAFNVFSMIDR